MDRRERRDSEIHVRDTGIGRRSDESDLLDTEDDFDDLDELPRRRSPIQRRSERSERSNREGPIVRPDTVIFAGAIVGIVWADIGLLMIIGGTIYAFSVIGVRSVTRLVRRHQGRRMASRDVRSLSRNRHLSDADR